MSDVNELKNRARREEQRENWSFAIELYSRALALSEDSWEVAPDLSLYNRIGDLHLRQKNVEEAVSYYLTAVDRYAEQGLHSGAVALCNKILRISPEQVEVYRKLGRLHAATDLIAEARNSFKEYAARMEERGDLEKRRAALLELAQVTADEELHFQIVDELVEAGRDVEAASQLVCIWERRVERDQDVGDLERRILRLDPSVELQAPSSRDPGLVEAGGTADVPESLTEVFEELEAADQEVREADAAGELREASDPEDLSRPDPAPLDLTEYVREDKGSPLEPTASGGAGSSRSAGSGDPSGGVGEGESDGTGGHVDLGDLIRRELGEEHAGDDPSPADTSPSWTLPNYTPEQYLERWPDGPNAELAREILDADDEFDFDDMLVGFRAQVAETVGQADPLAHCELGVALRQMGLLEDAIREFQIAARAPDPPVRAFELLGECFIERRDHRIAARVLTRALRRPGHTDVELLGVLYQLGIAHQELGETEQALDCFERVYSVDIDFRDISERMRACAL